MLMRLTTGVNVGVRKRSCGRVRSQAEAEGGLGHVKVGDRYFRQCTQHVQRPWGEKETGVAGAQRMRWCSGWEGARCHGVLWDRVSVGELPRGSHW